MTFSKIPKIKKLSQKERIGNIKNSWNDASNIC
jgi:hypothetical protein